MEVVLSAEQLRKCDEIAVQKFGVPSIILMENAGIDAATVATKILCEFEEPSVVILAGSGNNGGDGLVLARQLFNSGINTEIFVLAPFDKFKGDALTNLNICRNMKLKITEFAPESDKAFFKKLQQKLKKADLIVDAMLGTGLKDSPREPIATAISLVNASQSSVLAIDIPSGLDTDSGLPTGEVILANCTVTFLAPKKGFNNPDSTHFTGDIVIAGIGISPDLLIPQLPESDFV